MVTARAVALAVMLVAEVVVQHVDSVTPVTTSAGLEELLEQQMQNDGRGDNAHSEWLDHTQAVALFFCSVDTSAICAKAAKQFTLAAAELEAEGTVCGLINMDHHFDHSLLQKHAVSKPGQCVVACYRSTSTSIPTSSTICQCSGATTQSPPRPPHCRLSLIFRLF